MAWGRIDDDLYDHPKVVELLEEPEGWAALGFWVACLSWANKRTRKPGKTPGHVTRATVASMDRTRGPMFAGLLVKVGLWELHPDGGWIIHDFVTYLPKPSTSATRAAAGRKGGLTRAANAKASTELDTASTELEASPHELDLLEAKLKQTPGTGIGSSGTSGSSTAEVAAQKPARQRATRIPEDFKISDEMRRWGRERVPRVNAKLEHEKFCNYWSAKSGQGATKVDWVKTWQNWMLSAAERQGDQPTLMDEPAASPKDEFMRRR